MALETNAVIPGNVVAERPTLDTTKPIGEQLMKQLPVPTELVTALTGGTADTNIPLGQPAQTDVIPKLSDSMILQGKFPDTISQPRGSISAGGADQGLSLNNVRDGLILDTITSGLQTDTTVNNGLGAMDTMPISSNPLSAPSLDKLAMNMPNDILSVDPTAQSNINNDPTIRKIANILPRTGAMSELPLMSLDAEGFTAEGRFNTFQRGFNRTRKLSSKNGINVQVQLTPHLSTETKSTTSQKTKQDTRTANIQTDGSFLGSRLPVPPKRAGKGVVLSDLSNQQPFYDQSSLLGAFVDVLPKPVTPQIVPVDVPLPPPQTDILMVPSDTASTAPNTAPPTDVQVDTVQVLDIPPPPTVTFTSTFDAPSTQFDNPNVAPPAVPAGGVTTEFVSLENNPNWAVFDPTAISSDMNFADINPLVNGVIASGPEIAFVNTNDIKFTNAFDVAPVAYDQVSGPESPASSSAMTNSIPETSQLNASPDALNTNSNWQINTGSANTEVLVNSVADKIPNDKGLQFQEVVIAPLPAQSTNDLQVSADLPPPPPIF